MGKVGSFVGAWAFPPIINAFGGDTTTRGNTGPFWIVSGLALLSAAITLFFVEPLVADGMVKEDEEFSDDIFFGLVYRTLRCLFISLSAG